MTKLEQALQRTRWEIEERDKEQMVLVEYIRRSACSDSVMDMITFLPRKIERLKEVSAELKKLHEVEKMLEFIGPEERKRRG